jgi:hypothetical protein
VVDDGHHHRCLAGAAGDDVAHDDDGYRQALAFEQAHAVGGAPQRGKRPECQ